MSRLTERVEAARRREAAEADGLDGAPETAVAGRRRAPGPQPVVNGSVAAEPPPAVPSRSAEPPRRVNDALLGFKTQAVNTLFERIGVRINDSSLTEEQLKRFVREELSQIVGDEQLLLTVDERARLIQDIEDDALGLGPLQRLLEDPAITEIMVNGHERIYVERDGRLIAQSVCRFDSEEHLRRVIERIVGRVGRRIDESSPLGRRPPPRWIAGQRDHPPAGRARILADDPQVLRHALRGRRPHRVRLDDAGRSRTSSRHASRRASTSSSRAAPAPARPPCSTSCRPSSRPIERIVTIEDAIELKLQQEHVVTLEARPPNIEGSGRDHDPRPRAQLIAHAARPHRRR